MMIVCLFSTMPRDWLGRTSPKWPIFVEWDVKLFCCMMSWCSQSCSLLYRMLQKIWAICYCEP